MLFSDALGPIEEMSWGRFVVAGQVHGESEEGVQGVGKDIRIIGTEVSAWRERHGHVLKPAMVTGVYEHGIEVLIIGCGVYERLACPHRVADAITSHGIAEVIVAATPKACELYNRLYREGRRVALLAHGTC